MRTIAHEHPHPPVRRPGPASTHPPAPDAAPRPPRPGPPPRASAHDSPSTAISAARPTSTGLTATTPQRAPCQAAASPRRHADGPTCAHPGCPANAVFSDPNGYKFVLKAGQRPLAPGRRCEVPGVLPVEVLSALRSERCSRQGRSGPAARSIGGRCQRRAVACQRGRSRRGEHCRHFRSLPPFAGVLSSCPGALIGFWASVHAPRPSPPSADEPRSQGTPRPSAQARQHNRAGPWPSAVTIDIAPGCGRGRA